MSHSDEHSSRQLGVAVVVSRLGEDHAAGRGLEDPGHHDADVGIDEPPPAVDDHHRPVVEVADALARLLAFLDHPNAHFFAGQDRGLDGVRQLIDIEDSNPLDRGDPIEIVVGWSRWRT